MEFPRKVVSGSVLSTFGKWWRKISGIDEMETILSKVLCHSEEIEVALVNTPYFEQWVAEGGRYDDIKKNIIDCIQLVGSMRASM